MVCTECSWNQLWIGIIIGGFLSFIATAFGIWLVKYPLRPNLEKRFERNEINVHVGVMGWLNSLDSYFQFFYDMFEREFGPIRDLPDGEWLPNPYQADTVNETGGFDLHMKPEDEYHKALEVRAKLKDMEDNTFKNFVNEMNSTRKTIIEYMNKNEVSLDPMFRRLVEQYTTWTIFYINHLITGWNYTNTLHKRRDYAKQIIEILKQDNFGKISHIDEFIEKWQDYEESELINNNL